ncbi:MAG: hypothetical protein RR250_02560 [Akkermansia sp.]
MKIINFVPLSKPPHGTSIAQSLDWRIFLKNLGVGTGRKAFLLVM